jgi:hypothetical protein
MHVIGLLQIVPFLFILIAVLIFFKRVVKHPGLTELNKFTIILIVASLVLFFLPAARINLSFLSDLQLFRIIYVLPKMVSLTMTIFLSLFFIISAIKMRKGGQLYVLTAVWIVIVLLNLTELAWEGYKFFPLMTIFGRPGSSVRGIFENILLLLILAKSFIAPLFWVIISCISLLKIRKENERTPALQTP